MWFSFCESGVARNGNLVRFLQNKRAKDRHVLTPTPSSFDASMAARPSRAICSWRRRQRAANHKKYQPIGASLSPPPPPPPLACGSTDGVLAKLPHFQKVMRRCEAARELAAEAATGSARRIALHFFFAQSGVERAEKISPPLNNPSGTPALCVFSLQDEPFRVLRTH